MSFIATDLLKPAFERTKEFLLPFRFWTWIKLGFLLFFTAGVFNISPNFNFRFPDSGKSNPFEGFDIASFWMNNQSWIIPVLIALAVLILVCVVLSSFFAFTFMNSVDSGKVRIISYTKKNSRQGLSYLLFKIITTIIFLALLAAMLVPFIISIVNKSIFILPSLLLMIVMICVMIIAGLLIYTFVDSLVIYFMYLKNQKILSSMRQCWVIMKKNLKEVAIFWLIKIGIGLGLAICVTVAAVCVLIAFLLAGLILAGITYLFFLLAGLVAAIVLGIIFGLVFLAALIVAFLLLAVPVPVFLTNYNLLFVKKILKMR